MKKTFITLILCLIWQAGFTQNITQADLVGEWTFIELQDENGVKRVTIPMGSMVERVNRDSYILLANGEYTSANKVKSGGGTWFFDEEKNEINLELRISPKNPFLRSLKKAKIVKKRKDGFYYQKPVKKQILFYSKDSLTIADRDKYYLVYKRK